MAFSRLLFIAMALAVGSNAGNTVLSRLPDGFKWEICIHKPVKHSSVNDIIPSDAAVFDIDLSHAQEFPNMIPMIKKAGGLAICYFNAGAVQDWDADKDSFPAKAIGSTMDGYSDEHYIDIRDTQVVTIMKKRLQGAVAAGCDAVDPDNVDAWAQNGEDSTGFNLEPKHYVNYLTTLARYAHTLKTKSGGPLLVGQKNAPEIASQLAHILDFAVLEECRSQGFCAEFQPYIKANRPVLQIEYPPSIAESGSLSAKDNKFYCEESTEKHGDTGFSKVLKYESSQLDGWGQYCGGKSWTQPTIEE